jgi:hypothetical protein
MKESREEHDRLKKESDAKFDKYHEDYEKRMSESAAKAEKDRQDYEKRMSESAAKAEKDRQDYEKRMSKMEENMGNWSNNHGSFAEEYFFNAFDTGKQNFFGEEFNEIEKNLKPKNIKLRDEYDIVMYNHSSVAIVESKFKAHKNDIPKVIKKAETFRILCPDYKDFKIYLGLASLSFYKELEQECVEQGIAVIKQVGDTVVINDSGLKVF